MTPHLTPLRTVQRRRIAPSGLTVAVLMACLLVASCSDYTPMAMPDDRENPPLSGVFTGSQGEWVILRKTD